MSLFDTVICDYPLPLPDFSKEELEDMNKGEGGEIDWRKVEWQTKDLESMLDVYTLEDDGQIYSQTTEWITYGEQGTDAVDGPIKKYEKTAEINFYNIILGEHFDHWLEFKAVIFKGELKELNLVEYKKEDNQQRVEYVERMNKEIAKSKKRGRIYSFYRLLVTKFFGVLRFLVGVFVNITWKIERWLP